MNIHVQTTAVVPLGCTIAELRTFFDGLDGSARLVDAVLVAGDEGRVSIPDLVDLVLVVAPVRSTDAGSDREQTSPDRTVSSATSPDRSGSADRSADCSAPGAPLAEQFAGVAEQSTAPGAEFAEHTPQATPHTTPGPETGALHAAEVDISDLIPEAERIADNWDGLRNPSSRALAIALRDKGFKLSQERVLAIAAHIAARARTAQGDRSGTPHAAAPAAPQLASTAAARG
ncbi:hypothetical protein I6A60_00490 [Frankia sp. AgB1.9]|uniref:hypothetical protein n=1 Tax=unclassified Frankia TaxID=2632575 RepID=UPI0019344FBF|nr:MULTISPECIES: hypothetical protein [unclassified Frankia]MBL7487358.1 hypothetical protein [Frankia sp. AgW1.1]MBL7546366.1 hypothetical protein [Frankia sp. AgB1.9]MBL7618589.1 hypothetical protein [Frankia sp. AgB1.8]